MENFALIIQSQSGFLTVGNSVSWVKISGCFFFFFFFFFPLFSVSNYGIVFCPVFPFHLWEACGLRYCSFISKRIIRELSKWDK
ncbi:hypothetical protein CDL12_01640 [Handroanthus impetiginosus]|uniref:Uncharacterized protein n=1 Tax=Handroanthus impetiginosus TaxID=429701 RepID=A0A2G9I7J1_9LAMI|nr:hypothetical protein CDL12_01640 [Handroanthus impetiginosus]